MSDAKKLKALEVENAKLKKLLAEQMMDVSTLKEMLEKLLSPGARRKAANWSMTEKRYNQTRACALAGIDPRVSKRSANTALRGRLKQLSSERRRFGYRRLEPRRVCRRLILVSYAATGSVSRAA